MATKTTGGIDTEIFGRPTHVDYSERWVGYALLSMRVVMGWVLLQGGLTKLVTYLDADPANDWTAAGFLQFAIPAGNPFRATFAAMAGNPVVDLLVMWGLTLTGLCFILGVFLRFSAFWATVMMLLFWAAALQGGLLAGLPVAHGWVVDDHLVYAVLLFGLGAMGAGRVLGLDARIERLDIVQRYPRLTLLLG